MVYQEIRYLSCLRAFVTGRSLFRLPFSGIALCSHSDTAVFSHSSKLLLKPFSSLLPTCTCCTSTFSLFTSAYLYLLYQYLFSLHFCLPVPAVPVPFLSSLLPTCTCCTSTFSLFTSAYLYLLYQYLFSFGS